mmetsp:Transcript_12688/g.27337  ORF Transcript_12688/g.27337 Transcript_12688/m.27337 type:complete len:397 (+) Transcript_12688:110-1300(+)
MMLWFQLLLILPFSAAFLPTPASNNAITISRPTTTSATTTVTTTSSLQSSPTSDNEFTGFGNTGFLILAGGTGSRMKASMPKQFLTLRSCPVLHYSLHLFLEKIPAYCAANGLTPPAQVVLVLDPKYQPEYQYIVDAYGGKLAFANPGVERQGSVENGLNKLVELADNCEFIAVHDSARPLVTIPEILDVVTDAQTVGAAVLGVPCKATIKESDDGITVQRTIPRARLWEVHTPQVVKVEALLRGFAKVEREGLEVTDDVSIIEALGEPVKLTLGEYTNLKITTPEDMDVATAILSDRGEEEIVLGGAGTGVSGGGRGTGRGGGSIDGDAASEVDLSSSSGAGGAAAYGKANPFSQTPKQRMDEKSYNSMSGARMNDGYDTGRTYPAPPTPSKWHE